MVDSCLLRELEKTPTDLIWMSQNPPHELSRFKFSSGSYHPMDNASTQKQIVSLYGELTLFGEENTLLSFGLTDLAELCKPPAQLIYLPSLDLCPSKDILDSTDNLFEIRAVISLYSIHPFLMMNDFVDSLAFIKSHITATDYRAGAKVMNNVDAKCSLLLVVEG